MFLLAQGQVGPEPFARPDLVGDYEGRFRRSYQPKKDQEALAAGVRHMVAKARGRYASPISNRELAISAPDEPVTDSAQEATQLSLM